MRKSAQKEQKDPGALIGATVCCHGFVHVGLRNGGPLRRIENGFGLGVQPTVCDRKLTMKIVNMMHVQNKIRQSPLHIQEILSAEDTASTAIARRSGASRAHAICLGSARQQSARQSEAMDCASLYLVGLGAVLLSPCLAPASRRRNPCRSLRPRVAKPERESTLFRNAIQSG